MKTSIQHDGEGINPLIRYELIDTRLYQENIAAKARLRNTLVVLPTALGKTVITALVAAHFLFNQKQTRILMMAPTRPLVLQHHQSFLEILKIPDDEAIVLTGKITNRNREEIWRGNNHLFFATPQVVKNDLIREYIDLRQFSLLVFDECHRATKDYAYTYVAKKYMERAPWPIILGTTASPGAERKRVEEICRALFIEQIEYRSEEDVDVVPYINPVQTEWKFVELPEEYLKIKYELRELINERLSWLRRLGYLQKNIEYTTRRDLLELGESLRSNISHTSEKNKGPIFSAIVAQSAALTLFHALELLETQGINILGYFIDKIESTNNSKKSYRTIIKHHKFQTLKKNIDESKKVRHPKIDLILDEIKQQFIRKPTSRIIVFTQYRDTSKDLVRILNESLQVRAERFVGQATKDKDIGLSQDEQTEILRDFDAGEIKILVATCVAEEGLDIPSVELVIFYEPVPSEIRHIQRKGRTGRKAAGRAIILAAKDTFDIAYVYASKKRVEKMRKITRLLNKDLKSLIRLGPKPKDMPLTNDELKAFEMKADELDDGNTVESISKNEGKRFLAEVDRASRTILSETMKIGQKGVNIESITNSLTLDGISPNAVMAAINKLEDSGHIIRLSWDRIASIKVVSKQDHSQSRNETDVFKIIVETVFPGRVIAWINDRWRARILPEDFEGPLNLLKKDSTFMARGTLYRDNGILCFRVTEIQGLT
ncbi:DEAD/DEAH box helicase [Candidatus Bathyarchaeota archaeon]|nr:DEAD/DEAH box helicase [Candidatus Bathyarchaeota archaeon]